MRAKEISPLVRTHLKLQLERVYQNEIERHFTNQQQDLYHAKMHNTHQWRPMVTSGDDQSSTDDLLWPFVTSSSNLEIGEDGP